MTDEEVARLVAERDAIAHQLNIEMAETERAVALARALAFEEAARKCRLCNGSGEYWPSCPWCGDSTYEHECPPRAACPDCAKLRALAPLPPNLVAMPVGLVAKTREALDQLLQEVVGDPRAWACVDLHVIKRAESALVALNEVKP